VCFCCASCVLVSLVLCKEIGWEKRVQNDLFCVEWNVKPWLNQNLSKRNLVQKSIPRLHYTEFNLDWSAERAATGTPKYEDFKMWSKSRYLAVFCPAGKQYKSREIWRKKPCHRFIVMCQISPNRWSRVDMPILPVLQRLDDAYDFYLCIY